MSEELGRHEEAVSSMRKVSGYHEGSGISKEDLRQVQDRAPQGSGARDLHELETQTTSGIDFRFEISNLKFQIRHHGREDG
jgi:hypothetical protein